MKLFQEMYKSFFRFLQYSVKDFERDIVSRNLVNV